MSFGIYKIKAPWTDEQVEKLNDFQTCGRVHPFTCPGNSRCPQLKLTATNEGWVCACGEYKQNWAHSFMARGAPPICDLILAALKPEGQA